MSYYELKTHLSWFGEGGLIRNAIHFISSRSSVCRNHFVGVLVQRFCSLGSFAPEETEGFLSVQICLPQEVEFQVYAAGLVVTADALGEGKILCWITCIGLYSLNGSGSHTFTEHCPLACMMAMISLSTFMEHLWIFEPRASKWMRGFVIISNTIGHAPASLCIVFRVPRWKCYTRVALCFMIRLYKSVCLCISLRMPEHLCGRQEFSSLPSANTNSLENRYITWCARCWALIMSNYVDGLPNLLFSVQQVDHGTPISSTWFRSKQPAQAGLLKVVSDVASQAVKEAVEEDKASNQSKAVCRLSIDFGSGERRIELIKSSDLRESMWRLNQTNA